MLVIYCCIYSKTQQFQTIRMHYLTLSVCQESRCGITECLWLRVPHKAASKVTARASVISRLTLGGIFLPSSIPMPVGRPRFLQTAGQRHQFLAAWAAL